MTKNFEKNYGKTFKQLRKQRGFTLTSFTHLGISSSTLCKFENNKAMIKFDKLCAALKKMSITLSDYEKCLNDFKLSNHEILIRETIKSVITNDKEKIKKHYLEGIELEEHAFAFALKSTIEKPSYEENEFICDYFDTIKFWRYIDLYSLYLYVEHLKSRQLIYLVEGFFTEKSYNTILNSLEHRVKFTHIICKAIIILSSNDFKDVTNYFLEHIDPSKFQHTMYTLNLYHLAMGYWELTFNEENKGKK